MATPCALVHDCLQALEPLKGGLLPLDIYTTLETIHKRLVRQVITALGPSEDCQFDSNEDYRHLLQWQQEANENLLECLELTENGRPLLKDLSQCQTEKQQRLRANIVALSKYLLLQIAQLLGISGAKDTFLSSHAKQYNQEIKKEQIGGIYHFVRLLQQKIDLYMKIETQRQNPEMTYNNDCCIESAKDSNCTSESSCRSLLTEKMKNLPTNMPETEIQCINGKVIIKTNWLMKQMKKDRKIPETQPVKKLSNQFDSSPMKNVNSLQVEHLSGRLINQKVPSSRTIFKEMSIQDSNHKKEIRPKRQNLGCSRCDIY